ncbi:hypothetical protein Tco_1381161, partial [Tanacetum coccineum]
EGADVKMDEAQQGNENLETTQEQVIDDAHVTINTITKKTKVLVTSSSRSSNLASKFLIFSDIPQTDAEIVSPLDVHVHHEAPRTQAPTLLTIPVSSLTARIKEQAKDQLPQILPKEVSNFASPVIKKMIEESRNKVTLAKVPSQPQSTYEATFTLIEFELKKILIDKIEKNKDEDSSAGSDRGLKKRKLSKDAEPTTGLKKKDSRYGSSKGTKSQPKSSKKSVQSEELVFKVADSDIPKDQEGNLGDNEDEPRNETASRRPALKLLKGTHSNFNKLEYDFEECYKALSKKLDWENPEGGDYPFNISKPLPLITRGERQRVPFEYFINNDLKYLQRGISTMTYTTSTTKTKAAQYDLPGIKDMVPNIWSSVKVAYDRYALWVTHVKVMRKHGYGYLEEIVVRRDDNILYRFKEGDFPRLWINDIKDMLILVPYLQLGVESYQKKINVTKPDTTRSDLRKRHPYTLYKDPQGFIYVDDYKRNMLMRSYELYKFSDGTLTRLLSSLKDITKNIGMEYLPKRRWSTLEKKRAHLKIKDINKLLKERRMMRSLEKFVGGRLYGTDLRLLQRTI